MDSEDPIAQFFPGEEDVDLYVVLTLTKEASPEEIRKAYRRLALLYHPDKQKQLDPASTADASTKFQQIGFAYTVLSDEKRKERYDRTGKTSESLLDDVGGEDGWERYFEEMFEQVTRERLDEMKKEYQGSVEETADLQKAYLLSGGSITYIMSHIEHSSHADEVRFVSIISSLIEDGTLESTSTWKKGLKDEKGRKVRKKAGEKEAMEAEKAAQELGVWDEFYGDGKRGKRRGKGKGQGSNNDEGGEKDGDGDEGNGEDVLRALIQRKSSNMDALFDSLAVKYGGAESSSKGGKGRSKKRTAAEVEDDEDGATVNPKKKSKSAKIPPPPDIDDEAFERLQKEMFGDKAKSKTGGAAGEKGKAAKPERKGRSRRGKA
ncbi:hypothetical protein BOTBODRAFT_27788 [Botryobasidium botryosum FD-172 SS1]|uniref:J domain-containing protein n=1 Tax=Botryobasidium botryosum (strain FD-172 SS1) TaxID=930990 RepID=A0A067N0B4_BOTB1|nr:hypothetical protein BOTBODRAFT_27788 [Botryobasidium botryosum FD-172 SS1]